MGSSGINGTSIIIFINEWAGHLKSRGMGGRGQGHTYSSLQPCTIVRIRTCINDLFSKGATALLHGLYLCMEKPFKNRGSCFLIWIVVVLKNLVTQKTDSDEDI